MLVSKAWRTLRETRDPIAMMFAFGTNLAFGNVARRALTEVSLRPVPTAMTRAQME
jgi:hypothetical protein